MSIKLVGQLWELKLTRIQREVLQVLAYYADDAGGNIYPSVANVAWKVDYSERQVQRVLRGLEAAQVLVVESGAQGGRGRTRHCRLDLSGCTRKPSYLQTEKRRDASAADGEISAPESTEMGATTAPREPRKGDVYVSPFGIEKGDISDGAPTKRVTFGVEKGDIFDEKGDIQVSPNREENGRKRKKVLRHCGDVDAAASETPVQRLVAVWCERTGIEITHLSQKTRDREFAAAAQLVKVGATPEQLGAFFDKELRDPYWHTIGSLPALVTARSKWPKFIAAQKLPPVAVHANGDSPPRRRRHAGDEFKDLMELRNGRKASARTGRPVQPISELPALGAADGRLR